MRIVSHTCTITSAVDTRLYFSHIHPSICFVAKNRPGTRLVFHTIWEFAQSAGRFENPSLSDNLQHSVDYTTVAMNSAGAVQLAAKSTDQTNSGYMICGLCNSGYAFCRLHNNVYAICRLCNVDYSICRSGVFCEDLFRSSNRDYAIYRSCSQIRTEVG